MIELLKLEERGGSDFDQLNLALYELPKEIVYTHFGEHYPGMVRRYLGRVKDKSLPYLILRMLGVPRLSPEEIFELHLEMTQYNEDVVAGI